MKVFYSLSYIYNLHPQGLLLILISLHLLSSNGDNVDFCTRCLEKILMWRNLMKIVSFNWITDVNYVIKQWNIYQDKNILSL